MADDADGKWMTYADLAASRGISRASAGRLVRWHKWRKQADNHGVVRVLVPRDLTVSDIGADGVSDIARDIAALRVDVSAWREQAERAEQRADRAEARADRAEVEATALRVRLEQAGAVAADTAQAAARGQAADEARQTDGLLARLRRR
jgi:hypothetical protein